MGSTIGEILVSYDIDKNHTQVKDALIKLGYYDYFKFQNHKKKYHLPNTTLWHKQKTSDQAIQNLKIVCKSLDATLEKAIAVKATEFVGY